MRCAAPVSDGLEDAEDCRGFKAALIADYDAQTAVERELVLRLASLLWRMRRVISIETDLLRIQAEITRDRRTAFGAALSASDTQIAPDKSADWKEDPPEQGPEDNAHRRCESVKGSYLPMSVRDLTCCFLRLGNLDNGAFERLGRYNAALWKQTAQTLLLLQSIRVRYHPRCAPSHGRACEAGASSAPRAPPSQKIPAGCCLG
jgi:hypothetical protein